MDATADVPAPRPGDVPHPRDAVYAGAGLRLGAAILDQVISLGVLGVAFLIAAGMGGLGVAGRVIGALLIVAGIVFAAANQFAYPALYGRTVAKHLLGIEIRRTDDTSPRLGWGTAFAREIVKAIAAWPLGLSLLWMLFNDRQQGWHDLAAGTIVVRVPRSSESAVDFALRPLGGSTPVPVERRPAPPVPESEQVAALADEPASLAVRFGAAVVDVLAMILVLGLAGFTAMLARTNLGSGGDVMSFVLQATGLLTFFLYPFAWPARTGQTLGKHLVGIEIQRIEDGATRLGFGRAVGRELVKLLGVMALFIGILAALGNDARRGWHDQAARTVVVRSPRTEMTIREFLSAPFRG